MNASIAVLSSELAGLRNELAALKQDGGRREDALGTMMTALERQSVMIGRIAIADPNSKGSSPTPSPEMGGAAKLWGHEMRAEASPEESRRQLSSMDLEVASLLQCDGTLRQVLQKLKAARLTFERATNDGGFQLSVSPDNRLRTAWTVVLGWLLVFTCCVLPLRIAFPILFSGTHEPFWNGLNIFIEWYFVLDVILNFFTGFRTREGALDFRLSSIAKHYLRGWFLVDMMSSIPLDTISHATGVEVNIVLRLNKTLRVARLMRVMAILRANKSVRSYIDPAVMKLFQLILFLLLAWHYVGCFWWALCTAFDRPIVERLRVLDPMMQCTDDTLLEPTLIPCDAIEVSDVPLVGIGDCYLAAFYWAVFMSTGLNVVITPGLRGGLIMYECLVSFLGVCLQAYMLGATASEIANMDAQDTKRRTRLKEIKQHLRSYRVPRYLREPIIEYYERDTYANEGIGPLKDMPPSLKIQLAVTLHADFLRKVPFFASLDGTVSAALVLCMQSRVCLPQEIVINEGDTSPALYFIRDGRCEVLKLSGPVGLMPVDGGDPLGKVVATLRDHACFGEQSFLTELPSLATVRSVAYTTLILIYRSDFEAIQLMFPSLRVHVERNRQESLKEYKGKEYNQQYRTSGAFGGGAGVAWAANTCSNVSSFTKKMKNRMMSREVGQQAQPATPTDSPSGMTAMEQMVEEDLGPGTPK